MKKNNFCVIDIETKGLSARPESFVFGCMYAHNYRKVFYDREEMRKFLVSPLNPFKYVYAHNAEFDFTILFDNIIKNLDNASLFVGSTYIQSKYGAKIFANSLPILKSSVMALGKNLGIEKLELDNKFKEGKDNIIVTEQDVEYCYRDCEIVFIFLEKVFSYTKKQKPTIASCAMEIFKKEFLVRPLNRNPHNEIFRNSYYGGRVECFRFGKISPIYKYDINSLYPYVCTSMYFPDFNKIKRGRKTEKNYFEKMVLQNYEGCVLVTVSHKDNFVGVLPYVKNKEIIFPIGIFSGWYNFNELRFAISTGLVNILQVKEYYYAPKIIFTELKEYMLYFYKSKNENEGAEKLIFKFLLNGLTGKFAQKQYGTKIYFENFREAIKYVRCLDKRYFKCVFHHFSKDREDVFLEIFSEYKKDKKAAWNLPTVSSYITSQARITMLPFFLENKKHLCYTDTDSLVMTKPLQKKYISETILGMFKKEHETDITIIGNKHYETTIAGKKVVHIKGVGRNYTQRGTEFKFFRMIRSKEGLRQDLHAGMFVEVVKNLTKKYSKRKVSKNNLTKTLKINE